MASIKDYRPIVGRSVIEELELLAAHLKGVVVQNINSTAVGGGVAEILTRFIPLLRELGVDARWDVIKGDRRFFEVTKKFHNALHGREEEIPDGIYEFFLNEGARIIDETDIYGDIVVVHDPQPIMLVRKKRRDGKKWVWRCHVDIAHADKRVFAFLKQFIMKYDGVIFSSPLFSRRLALRQFLISPSIDPLSDKNKEIPQETIDSVLKKYGVKRDKPVITQVSRFDYLKDPVGVIDAFNLVKKYNDCQLVLAGNSAADDPESDKVLSEVREKACRDPDIHILLIPPEQNDIDINALQRASTVIIQKSIREGFGLVVSEALWKAKPVVASAVGGIPLQVEHQRGGLLCRSVEGAARAVRQLLNNPEYAGWLGRNGKEHIRQNFLLTRHLRDYMLLFIALYHGEDIIHL